MAQVYIKNLPDVAKQTKQALYSDLSVMLLHLDALGIDLTSIVIDPLLRTATITLSGPLATDQALHLKLSG